MGSHNSTLGAVLRFGIDVVPSLLDWVARVGRGAVSPYKEFWKDETMRYRRGRLFGLHTSNGLWMGVGRNAWLDERDGERDGESVFAPDGVPRPAFNFRGKSRVLAVGAAANEPINSNPGTRELYRNHVLLGADPINRNRTKALRAVAANLEPGLTPLRFRTDIRRYTKEVYESLPKLRRVFEDDGRVYSKSSVVDQHPFLVDLKGQVECNAVVKDGVIVQDFLLLTILPSVDRTGRRILVTARYGAAERLHDILIHRDIVDALWEDRRRPSGDDDMRLPWCQALFRVGVSYWGGAELYASPELIETHWMPEYGPVLEPEIRPG